MKKGGSQSVSEWLERVGGWGGLGISPSSPGQPTHNSLPLTHTHSHSPSHVPVGVCPVPCVASWGHSSSLCDECRFGGDRPAFKPGHSSLHVTPTSEPQLAHLHMEVALCVAGERCEVFWLIGYCNHPYPQPQSPCQ